MNPTDEQIWATYFAGVASMRFHPRNSPSNVGEKLNLNHRLHEQILDDAARIADEMLKRHRSKFPCGPK